MVWIETEYTYLKAIVLINACEAQSTVTLLVLLQILKATLLVIFIRQFFSRESEISQLLLLMHE